MPQRNQHLLMNSRRARLAVRNPRCKCFLFTRKHTRTHLLFGRYEHWIQSIKLNIFPTAKSVSTCGTVSRVAGHFLQHSMQHFQSCSHHFLSTGFFVHRVPIRCQLHRRWGWYERSSVAPARSTIWQRFDCSAVCWQM